jgi:hypothetical protein
MKKVVVIFILVVTTGFFFFFRHLGLREVDTLKRLKSNPKKIAYFLNNDKVFITLVSSDTACMQKIRIFYEKGNFEDYLPGCFEHGIPINDTVYVIPFIKENFYTKIAYFYKRPNGSERYFIGYIMTEALHDTPYSK